MHFITVLSDGTASVQTATGYSDIVIIIIDTWKFDSESVAQINMISSICYMILQTEHFGQVPFSNLCRRICLQTLAIYMLYHNIKMLVERLLVNHLFWHMGGTFEFQKSKLLLLQISPKTVILMWSAYQYIGVYQLTAAWNKRVLNHD